MKCSRCQQDNPAHKIVLKEPTGLVLPALGKPSSNVPFMMPKRVAETDANTQISDTIGSGPFIFKKDEWKPGDKAVWVRNPNYRPRAGSPSWLAGGKVVKVDRVEWRAIPDHQTAINALLAGEIDYIEAPPHDLLPVLKKDPNVRLVRLNLLGGQYTFRFNTLHEPFDNPKVRQAAGALLAPDFLVYPENGAISTFKGFEIIVIGGLGSILGSIVGGVLLGVIEALGSVFISAAYKDLYGFLLLIALLVFRPTGLFGERERTA